MRWRRPRWRDIGVISDPWGGLDQARATVRTIRLMPAGQGLLRLAIAVLGLLALPLPGQPPASPGGVLLGVAVLGLVVAVAVPGGVGPLLVLGFVGGAWLLAFPLDSTPPWWRAALLAGVLYLFHSACALAAAMPATARIEPRLIGLWAAHCGVALALGGVVAALAYRLGRVSGSLPLELLGLGGAVALIAVPVGLTRRGR